MGPGTGPSFCGEQAPIGLPSAPRPPSGSDPHSAFRRPGGGGWTGRPGGVRAAALVPNRARAHRGIPGPAGAHVSRISIRFPPVPGGPSPRLKNRPKSPGFAAKFAGKSNFLSRFRKACYNPMDFKLQKGLEEARGRRMFPPPLRFLGCRRKPDGETNQGPQAAVPPPVFFECFRIRC